MAFELCEKCGAGAGYGHTLSCPNNEIKDHGMRHPLKDDEGKVNWSVFPFREARYVVKAFEHGASPEKYKAPFSYRDGVPMEKLAAAAIRHAIEILEGNLIDDGPGGSGLPHAALIATNGLMLISQYEREVIEGGEEKE
jgi:hypothetical protein